MPKPPNTGVTSTLGYLKITVLFFAIAALWSALHTIILPVRLLDLVPESQKNTYLGLMSFTGLILALATQPIVSGISDRTALRFGRMPFIIAGILIASVTVFGLGFFQTYLLVFVAYALTQIATNTAQGPYQAFIPEMVPPLLRGRASGIKSLMESLGGVALLYPAAFLMDKYTATHVAFWLYAALGMASVLLLAMLLPTVALVKEPKVPLEVRQSRTPQRLRFRTLLKENRRFIRFLVSRTLFSLTFTTIQTFALYFLMDVAKVEDPAQATAGFISMAAIGMVISAYPAGFLSDRHGRRSVGLFSGVFGVLAVLLFLFFPRVFPLLLLASGFFGLAFGIYLSTNWALATDLAVRGEEASYLALANAATAGGSAAARLVGPVIDLFNGIATNMGYTAMLLICLAAVTMASVLLIERR